MAHYQIREEQWIEASLAEVWEFISNPHNLKIITPDYMGFQVTTPDLPKDMYPGMIITYKVSPVLGIKMDWMTEITQVRDQQYFVDEQRLGPYKIWHHQHLIEEKDEGVLMKDIVTYVPPFGFLGKIANTLFIKNQLNEIFDYRKEAVYKYFGMTP